MNTPSPWLLMLIAGAGTFLLRLSFMGLVRGDVPPLLQRILRLVPAAVLAALVVPAVVPADAAAMSTPDGWVRPAAAVLATLIALRTGSIFATLAVGMAALWLLTLLI